MFQQQNLVQINNYEQVTTKTFSYITVQIRNVVLNKSVEIQVIFFDAKKNMGDMKTLTLTGTDYTNWGNDDNYIVTMACQKLGLTLASTVDASVSDVAVSSI